MTSVTIQFFEKALLTSCHYSLLPGESLDASIHRYTGTMEQLFVECLTCLEAFKDNPLKLAQFEKEFAEIRNHLTVTAQNDGFSDGESISAVHVSIRNRALYLVNFRIIGMVLEALKEMKSFNKREPMAETSETSLPISSKEDENLIKGVRGLATYLDCGVNTAQKIVNSKILQDNKLLYFAGRSIRVGKDKLDAYLKANPEAFKRLSSV